MKKFIFIFRMGQVLHFFVFSFIINHGIVERKEVEKCIRIFHAA